MQVYNHKPLGVRWSVISLAAMMIMAAVASGARAQQKQAYLAFPRQGDLNTWERLTFTCLQGIANRKGPRIYLKMQRSDAVWVDWYEKHYGFNFVELDDPYALFTRESWRIRGYVLVDRQAPATANIGANFAATANLLPVTKRMLEQHGALPDLKIVHDLRNRFRDASRLEIAEWTARHQVENTSNEVLCNLSGPSDELNNAWLFSKHNVRDYVVARRGLFTYLSSDPKHPKEQRMKGSLMERMKPLSYVMGWHADHSRGERWHVRQASQHGLTVLCSSTSSNFSFHRHVEPRGELKPSHNKKPTEVSVKDKVYLTFVYSDGDSLNWFSRGHGYEWEKGDRGAVPFGWEAQPLFALIAPGMLEYFYATAKANDRFIASASGIGYTYPDAMPRSDLRRYLRTSRKYLKATGLKTLTVLPFDGVGDQKARLYDRILGDQLYGIIEGYWVKKERKRRHMDRLVWTPIVLPPLNPKDASSPKGMASRLRKRASNHSRRPLFLPVHLPAHRMSYNEVAKLAKLLDSSTFEIVGPNAFYIAMRKARQSESGTRN